MRLPLRLALVPIGIALASKGLQALTDEADRLDREIDARRAALGIYDHGQPEPDAEQAADPWAELEEPPRRPVRRDVGRLVAAAVGFTVGAYLAMRTERALRDRAAAELAAPMDLPEPAPGTCGVFPAFYDPPTPCTLAPHATIRHSWEGGRGHLAEPGAPVATEPGCTHPGCILNHPHAGPAILDPAQLTPIGHVLDYPCPDDCPCKKYK